ncbi:O-methyltransferase [bacterium BMS3Bbin10]|nr:O-methyltransferase [bacterium BMS3Bbin10]
MNDMAEFSLDSIVPVNDYRCPPELKREKYSSLYDWVNAHLEHPVFNDLADCLWATPKDSTISAPERAFLYASMREMKAKNTLEIGTFTAGTTQLMACAAYQDGGMVYTIDPYGADRAPGLIAAWPKELAERVIFQPKFSTEFLGPLSNNPKFDLVFIDGNHRYPNVLHDLYASDESLVPGGIIIGDNAEQLDVMDACRHFLRDNEGYEGVGVHLTLPIPGSGSREIGKYVDTELRPRGARSAFVILRKPERNFLQDRAITFWVANIRELAAPVIKITGMSELASEIRVVMHLNSHPRDKHNPNLQSLQFIESYKVSPGKFSLNIDCGLELSPEADGQVNLATIALHQVTRLGLISDLCVTWGDTELLPNSNFLPS